MSRLRSALLHAHDTPAPAQVTALRPLSPACATAIPPATRLCAAATTIETRSRRRSREEPNSRQQAHRRAARCWTLLDTAADLRYIAVGGCPLCLGPSRRT